MSGVFSSPSRETKNQLNWPYMFSGDASHFVFVDVAAPSPLFIIVPNWLLSTRSCLGGRQDKNQLLGSHYMATPSNNNQVYLVFRYISGSPTHLIIQTNTFHVVKAILLQHTTKKICHCFTTLPPLFFISFTLVLFSCSSILSSNTNLV